MNLLIRNIAKNPGFTAAALITLALGIGVNTTAFTVLNQLVLQTVPFRNPGALVQIWGSEPGRGQTPISPGDYFDIRDGNSVFEGVAAYVPYSTDSLVEPGQPAVNVSTNHVSANFLGVFGVEPQMGRAFLAEEDAHKDDVALVSNFYWREHFGADPRILGRTVRLSGKMVTIIGVLPVSMDNPTLFNGRLGFWVLDHTQGNSNIRNLTWYYVAARLKPSVTLEQARANLTAIGKRLAKEFPNTNAKRQFRLVQFPTSAMDDADGSLTWMVMAISGLVLVIACVNLANLQLVRTTRRAQEIALRLALGCSRGRIVRTVIEESVALSMLGGLLALLVAKWGNLYVGAYLNLDLPLDLRVLAFTLSVSVVTGVAFGAIPAWIASQQNLNSALKAGGRGSTSGWARRTFREVLVVTELVLALGVLSAAAFFINGIYKLSHQKLGWNGDHALFGQITLDHDTFGEHSDPRSVAFTDRLKDALKAVPGVKVAAAGAAVPEFAFGQLSYRIDGQPAPDPGHEPLVESGNVDPGFFGIYEIPIVMGRDFDSTDRLGSRHVVIVSESMAKKCWPGTNPIGKRIGTIDRTADPTKVDWAEVVGVVRDYHHLFDFLGGDNGTKLFRPWAQFSHRWVFFHVGTNVEPDSLKESIRRAVAGVAPDFALDQLVSVKSMALDVLSFYAFLRKALLELAVLGLTLSAVGIYGVIATLVSERTREIGIRMALGAQGYKIVWLFLGNGLVLSFAGAVLGGAAAFGIVHTLTKLLPIIPGFNPWAIVPIAAFLVLVAVVSCWIPALRSTKVDPSVALRSE